MNDLLFLLLLITLRLALPPLFDPIDLVITLFSCFLNQLTMVAFSISFLTILSDVAVIFGGIFLDRLYTLLKIMAFISPGPYYLAILLNFLLPSIP